MDGKKRADCLSPPQGGRVSACSGRCDDAQDTRDTGVFFCFVFCHVTENEEIIEKYLLPDRVVTSRLPVPRNPLATRRHQVADDCRYFSKAVNPDRATSTILSLPMASKKSSIIWDVPVTCTM